MLFVVAFLAIHKVAVQFHLRDYFWESCPGRAGSPPDQLQDYLCRPVARPDAWYQGYEVKFNLQPKRTALSFNLIPLFSFEEHFHDIGRVEDCSKESTEWNPGFVVNEMSKKNLGDV